VTTLRAQARSAGFTLIEILVVVVIIGIISAAVLLSVNLTGRDRELERESDRLLSLVNYAREQAELQTREYGLIFHDDGYQFVAYDVRRGVWREIYEDEALRLRKLPDGLDFKLIVESRPVVLVATPEARKPDPKAKTQAKSLKDVAASLQDAASLKDPASLKAAVASGHTLEDAGGSLKKDDKPVTPQVMFYSSGDLTSFEITVERDGGLRSVTLAQDEKGQVIAKPMVESKT
jgi:general secretion pathway protein H